MLNVEKTVDEIILFIQDYFKKNNASGVVLGISGGKDSAVAAGLFCKALGPENVIGLSIPIHSKETDEIDAKKISDFYKFLLHRFDLTRIYDTFLEEAEHTFLFNQENLEFSDSHINLKPRLRMSTFYFVAQEFSQRFHKKYLVAGTSNLCEIFVGYFTKGGDSVHDISILGDFSVDEVIEIGKYIGVPEDVLYKKPSDGLSNVTDEEKLGVTYKNITDYMNGIPIEKEISEKIKNLHEKNAHKFEVPTFKKGCKYDSIK